MQQRWLFAVCIAVVIIVVAVYAAVVSFACFVSQQLEISENFTFVAWSWLRVSRNFKCMHIVLAPPKTAA